MTNETETPQKYRAESRKFDDKAWLYEQYWEQMKSQLAIAEECDVSQTRISAAMKTHGIPARRTTDCDVDDTYDPRNAFGYVDSVDTDWSITVEGESVVDPSDDETVDDTLNDRQNGGRR